VTPEGNPLTLSNTAALVALPGTTLTVKVAVEPDCIEELVALDHIMKGCNWEASPPCVRLS